MGVALKTLPINTFHPPVNHCDNIAYMTDSSSAYEYANDEDSDASSKSSKSTLSKTAIVSPHEDNSPNAPKPSQAPDIHPCQLYIPQQVASDSCDGSCENSSSSDFSDEDTPKPRSPETDNCN